MKKFVLSFLMIFSAMIVANAQNSEWNEAVNEFLSEFGDQAKEMTESFRQMGINATMTADYDAPSKELVMEVMFDPQMWNMFNADAMKAGKAENLRSYQESYRTDPEFREFIDLMQKANAKFRVKYSCRQGGTVKSKDFTITPAEIMRESPSISKDESNII